MEASNLVAGSAYLGMSFGKLCSKIEIMFCLSSLLTIMLSCVIFDPATRAPTHLND